MSDPIPTPSRQVTCQRAHVASGLCRYCHRPRWLDTTLCEKCLKRMRTGNRRYGGFKPWEPGSDGRPPEERRSEAAQLKIDRLTARLAAREVVTERMRSKLRELVAKLDALRDKLISP